jgi:hypothetical protein
MIARTCARCAAVIGSQHPRARYCGHRCARRAERARRRVRDGAVPRQPVIDRAAVRVMVRELVAELLVVRAMECEPTAANTVDP